ncbi:MAG: hypothetical protein B6U72_01170 [Candidatus Altiarchaeales archaeon ex4484_2]|nr:MAG: hypothetical protein B6U72_01170 [Candidatus Altiarchaeales archaeon ex4484_2]
MTLGKELTERDALYQIKWDHRLVEGEYMVHYIDRSSHELRRVSFSDIGLRVAFFLWGIR